MATKRITIYSVMSYSTIKKMKEMRNKMKMFQIIKSMRHVKLKSIDGTTVAVCTFGTVKTLAHICVEYISLCFSTHYSTAANPSKHNQKAATQYLGMKDCQPAE
jgi:hypothetical protein